MTKTKALAIFTAVTETGVSVTIGNTFDADGTPDYFVQLTPTQITVDDLVRVNDVLRDHEASVQIPGMRVATDQELAEQQAREEATRQAQIAQEEAVNAKPPLPDPALGGGAEQDGGVAADQEQPTPEPSPQPFAGEGDGGRNP